MVRFMGPQLRVRHDGRVDISHRLVKEAVREGRYTRNAAAMLLAFLLEQDALDETRRENAVPLIFRFLRAEKEEKAVGEFTAQAVHPHSGLRYTIPCVADRLKTANVVY